MLNFCFLIPFLKFIVYKLKTGLKSMKNILVVNDDGISSKGLMAAVEALKAMGKITVVAPTKQQSGVGRSLTLRQPLEIKKESGFSAGVNAYSVNGTPVDAVIVALFSILSSPPELLVSGINIGENMSSEITTSGTVCAAIEAANHDIPAIAISLHLDEGEKMNLRAKHDFSLSKKVLRRISENILKKGLPNNVDLLNINVPNGKIDNCRIKLTKLARRMYNARVERKDVPHGASEHLIDGDAIFDAERGTDVHTVRVEKNVSVTPLKIDFTSYESFEELDGYSFLSG